MSSKKGLPEPLTDDTDFNEWCRDIEVWEIATEYAKDKWGALIYRALEGKAKRCCRNIPISDIKGETGYETIMNKLKELYGMDEGLYRFQAIERFEEFVRPEDMTVLDFINEWESYYDKVEQIGKIKLPEDYLAYKLFKAVRISDENKLLTRATITNFKISEAKEKMKAIFAMQSVNTADSSDTTIKVEPASDLYFAQDNRSQKKFHSHNRKSGSKKWGNRKHHAGSGSSGAYQSAKPYKNPIGSDGKRMTCHECGCDRHLVKKCPYRNRNNDDFSDDDAEVTLLTKGMDIRNGDAMVSLLCKTFNSALLDTGCPTTVCGKRWLECYLKSLPEDMREKVKYRKSAKTFRFGDGKPVLSESLVSIPAVIGGTRVNINAEVVPCDVPFLLSKKAMSKAKAKLLFGMDTIEIFGKNIKLETTANGHYKLPLLPETKMFSVFLSNEELSEMDSAHQRNTAKKLHVQFGHADGKRLVDLLHDAGVVDSQFEKLVYEVEKNCETCLQHKRKKPHSAVGFSLGKEFNHVVSLDLKTISGHLCLHMIDNATRFSMSIRIPSKHKEVIVDHVFKHWIQTFGRPQYFLSDNGGEFNNKLFRELGNALSTEILTTGAESPWSNGITERHNALIAKMVLQILASTDVSFDMALGWSVAAKNSLKNVHGYSPNQLVFGRNPNFPISLNSALPALTNITSDEIIASHLNAMIAGRKAFVESEASEKLKRALAKQTRSETTQLPYETGMKVFYKMESSARWQGPAEVIGKSGSQVYIKHGGSLHRVNPCNLQRVPTDGVTAQEVESLEISVPNSGDTVESDEESDEGSDEELAYESSDSSDNELVHEDNRDPGRSTNAPNLHNPSLVDGTKPQVGSTVRLKLQEDNNWQNVKVLGRAGKASGANRFWFNIENCTDGDKKSVDFSKVESWETVPEEVLLVGDCNEILHAKSKELDNLVEHDVFDEVEYTGQPLINVRWVITEKFSGASKVVKARLVAKGFEESSSNLRKDSPTCLKENLRLVLSIASNKRWKIHSLDVKSAFLQGKKIARSVFLRPPIEAHTDKVWKLKKTIYGLSDASRSWYLRVQEVLESVKMVMCKYDYCLFVWFDGNGELAGIICIHVDDFFYCGTALFHKEVITVVKCAFKIGSEDAMFFNYLGLQIEQRDGCIFLHQYKYIEELKPLEVKQSLYGKEEPLSKADFENLRSTIGQLAWVANQTRPDIAFDVCQLSVNLKNATYKTVIRANKCIKKLKNHLYMLKYPVLGDISKAKVVVFADASFANLEGGASQGGHLVFLVGENGGMSILSWSSKKLDRVVNSTSAAETMSLLKGFEAGYLLKTTVGNLISNGLDLNVDMYTDCKNLKQVVNNSKNIDNKRLKIDVCTLRDHLLKKELSSLKWICSSDQLADALTKEGVNVKKLINVLYTAKFNELKEI